MVANQSGPAPDIAELKRRIDQALSLIGHRKPTPHVMDLVRLSLIGASIIDLVDLERAG